MVVFTAATLPFSYYDPGLNVAPLVLGLGIMVSIWARRSLTVPTDITQIFGTFGL